MTPIKQPTCRAEGCDHEAEVRGHCVPHYNVLRHEIANSRGTDTPITWEMLEDAGVVPPDRGKRHRHGDFLASVRAKIAKAKEPTQ